MSATQTMTERVEKLSPKPGDTVIVFVPEERDCLDDDRVQLAVAALHHALKNPDLPPGDIRGFVLPADFRVEVLDHAALARSLGLAPTKAVAERLRARAAALQYEGGQDAARVLREEADGIGAGRIQ